MSKTYLQGIVLVLLILLIFLQYRLWFQKTGIKDFAALKHKYALQMKINAELQQANDQLAAEIKRLRENREGITEARARNEFGMIKKGETFYQIVK